MRVTVHIALRLIPALLLAFALSGAPHAVATVFALEDTCTTDCAGSMGTKECPPTCTQGACAKVFAAVLYSSLPVSCHQGFAQPRMSFSLPEPVADPRLSPALKGVFHPPKA